MVSIKVKPRTKYYEKAKEQRQFHMRTEPVKQDRVERHYR